MHYSCYTANRKNIMGMEVVLRALTGVKTQAKMLDVFGC
jgi:hypothetical protein